ncbi:xyloglucan O-acetyltransferase 1 [Primulina eburnea]|uniref:xyloglucan O-acetyltransferase 1 n=1 Tax=Primulina eburnea TaxID=1245227 RepID=UPI003C6BE604
MGSSNNINPFKEQMPSHFLKRLLPYIVYGLTPLAFIHLYIYPFSFSQNYQFPPPSQEVLAKNGTFQTLCDYTYGKWVPNRLDPLYNGTTCETIKYGQNCMLFGRPDKDYLHWRWKPRQCKLPRFDPKTFLTLLENKHMAFVGDSIARNQLESLLCMVSVAAKPQLFYTDGGENKFRKWNFPDRNINISIYWSPFLVKGIEKNTEKNFNTLFLDSLDENWAADLDHIDMLVLSIGHWYLHPAVYYYGDSVLGCHYCKNYSEIEIYDVFGKALNTTFKEVIKKRKGLQRNPIHVFLVTFSPHHFEGEWDKFGACPKIQPFGENEVVLEGMNAEMRRFGLEEVKEAKLKAKQYGSNVIFEALDISKLTLLRPDGHPGPYMNPFPFAKGVTEHVQNDCVHWCLPGAIDTWNEILLDMIKRMPNGD